MATEPNLSKAELAALDFLIADAQASGDVNLASWAAAARVVARVTAREAVREAVRQVVRAAIGGRTDFTGPLTDADLDAQIKDELGTEGVSLEQLIQIRNRLS